MVGLPLLFLLLIGLTSSKKAPNAPGARGSSYQQPPARYLPKIKHKSGLKNDHKVDSEWLEGFNREQQKYCGNPAVPIEFPRRQSSFEPVSSSSWPWMVSLYKTPTLLNKFFDLYPEKFQRIPDKLLQRKYSEALPDHKCGGTLISPQFVLTAAHCLLFQPFEHGTDVPMEASLQLRRLLKTCGLAGTLETCHDALEQLRVNHWSHHDAEMFWDEMFTNEFRGVPLNGTDLWQLWIGVPQRSGLTDNTRDLLKIRIKKIIPHPTAKYLLTDQSLLGADLALLQLERPITEFSESVRPVCLSDRKLTKQRGEEIQCAVAGWGVYVDEELKREYPEQLEAAPYRLTTPLKCRRKAASYRGFKYSKVDWPKAEQLVCASERKQARAKTSGVKTKLCYGDSGGPLICKYPDNRWYQIGVTSHGKARKPESCEINRAPDVFTNVPTYMSWILSTLQQHQGA